MTREQQHPGATSLAGPLGGARDARGDSRLRRPRLQAPGTLFTAAAGVLSSCSRDLPSTQTQALNPTAPGEPGATDAYSSQPKKYLEAREQKQTLRRGLAGLPARARPRPRSAKGAPGGGPPVCGVGRAGHKFKTGIPES